MSLSQNPISPRIIVIVLSLSILVTLITVFKQSANPFSKIKISKPSITIDTSTPQPNTDTNNKQAESKSDATPSAQTTKSAPVESAQPNIDLTKNSFCMHVPVLTYHHIEPLDAAKAAGHESLTVDPKIFEEQMSYLNDHGYRSISGEELPQALSSHQQLGKVAVVTIDDGYNDFYNYAFPIIKKYNITSNIMIPTGLMENPGYLSWSQLKEMVDSGLVHAYDHTWSHYSVSSGDESKIELEIMTAKKQLEEHLGKTVTIFTFPFGLASGQSINVLKRNGFIGAYSTISSSTQCENNIYAIRRTRIGNSSLSQYGF